MPALAQFLRDELPRRGWTVPEFVTKAKAIGPGLSLSNAYQIIRDGKDNVETDTFEVIASTLGMTPAQLMVAIGKGSEELSPTQRDVFVRIAHMLEITGAIEGISDDIARAYLEKVLDPEDYQRYVNMVLKARAVPGIQNRRSNNSPKGRRNNKPDQTDISGEFDLGHGITACQQVINSILNPPLSPRLSVL